MQGLRSCVPAESVAATPWVPLAGSAAGAGGAGRAHGGRPDSETPAQQRFCQSACREWARQRANQGGRATLLLRHGPHREGHPPPPDAGRPGEAPGTPTARPWRASGCRSTPGPHSTPAGARTRADAAAVVEFRGRHPGSYSGGDMGLDRATLQKSAVKSSCSWWAPPARASRPVMCLLIKEFDPSEGLIRVAGRDLADIGRRKVPFYRRNIGVVFQDFKLLPSRTVHDNVAYALQVTGAGRRQIRDTVPDILRLTGLSTKLHNYPDQLSGGEQQRVAIARAFVNHPPLLLADEPTGNLDPETSIGIMQLLYRINRAGTTVLVATHDSEMVNKMRRRVIELKRGRIVRDEATGLYGPSDETTDGHSARAAESAQTHR